MKNLLLTALLTLFFLGPVQAINPPSNDTIPLFSIVDSINCLPSSFPKIRLLENAATYKWRIDGGLVSTQANYQPWLGASAAAGPHLVELEITTHPNQLILSNLQMLSAAGWGLEFYPDPYFVVKKSDGSTLYTSPTLIDGAPVVAVPGNCLLNEGQQYTLELYDWDPFDPNDLMGACTFTAGAGTHTCSDGGTQATFVLTDAAENYTWAQKIYANEVNLYREPDGAMVAATLYELSAAASFNWQFEGEIIPDAPNTNVLPAIFVVEEGLYSVQVSDAHCFASETLSDASEVLMEDLVIQAWPNPSNGYFQVSLAPFAGQKVTLRVSDSAGRTVFEQAEVANPVQTVDLSDLPAGVYYLSVSDGEQMAVRELQVL